MDRLDMIYDDQQELKKDVKKILQRVSRVEVIAAIWGMLGGVIVGVVARGWF